MAKKSKHGISVIKPGGEISAYQETHEEPIPTPADLEHYEKTVPGLANRIVEMVEKQQQHLLDNDNVFRENNHKLDSRGQWIIGILCLCGIAVSAWGLYLGNNYAAFLGLVPMVCIVALSRITRPK